MTFAVMVHPSDGRFEASLVGASDIRAMGSTRAEALAASEVAIAERLDRGDLVALEVRRPRIGQPLRKIPRRSHAP
jgi:hypothetical protein